MAETYVAADLEQLIRLGRTRRRRIEPKGMPCPPEQRGVTGGIGGGQGQELPCLP